MNTPVRVDETIEGSRTMRNRPYPVLKCSSTYTHRTWDPPPKDNETNLHSSIRCPRSADSSRSMRLCMSVCERRSPRQISAATLGGVLVLALQTGNAFPTVRLHPAQLA